MQIAEQQHVDVDHPRPVAHAAGRAADLSLDLLARVEQLLGPERGLDPQAGVEEVGLVEDQADRLGLVHRRRGEHVDPVARQRRDRRRKVARRSPTFEPSPR